ncbi:hypothetical protein TWF594_003905 [Orbilia oligospora]|uniref:Uncharacterized protein n=1 Tax=Orbilia oligospora TaxID=2813651 RepID=A0A7C8NYE7_ORBOL|nr:hypothetical protein TWF703_002977 [Orbilia oligospora]KAF3120409.1 hypothetical protein TWF594_003905 [Orbilia oligospora]
MSHITSSKVLNTRSGFWLSDSTLKVLPEQIMAVSGPIRTERTGTQAADRFRNSKELSQSHAMFHVE